MQFVIDVSSNNHPNEEAIDWNRVKAAGASGVYIKATECYMGPNGQVVDYVNPWFGKDYFGALAAGVTPGAYHFWHTGVDLDHQLNHFHTHYGPRIGDLPAGWDAEDNDGNWSWSSISQGLQRVSWVLNSWYGSSSLYMNGSWRDALMTVNNQLPWGSKLWYSTGRTDAPLAWMLQFAPMMIDGCPNAVDWNVL